MNNTLNNSQHQMFGKTTNSKFRNKKDSWATGQLSSYNNNLANTYSNQNSAKKQPKPSKLISTTINLKDLVDNSRCGGYEKTMHS